MMALTIRNLSRFANAFNVITPRSHNLELSCGLKHVIRNHSEQYLNQYEHKLPETVLSEEVRNNYNSILPDNRELLSDIVKKENVFRLEHDETLGNSSGHIRFGKDIKKADGTLLVKNPTPQGRPPPEKLQLVYNTLADDLPKLFSETLNYTIYHKDVVFEDHIRNLRTIGIYNYMKQVLWLKTIGHVKFAYVKLEILKITQHPEDGTVRVRWRISGLSALKVMLKFWKYKFWKVQENVRKSEVWYDGFSTFYVDADGKIVKHIADKMMPDDDRGTTPSPISIDAAKLALIVGIIPRFSDFTSII